MDTLSDFRRAVEDAAAYTPGLKENDGRIIGYFCTYTPEEIIYAAGIHPMRLFGSQRGAGLAEAHLQAYCCSLVRGALEEGLSGRLDFLDGTVFPHTCDSIQRLSDLWRLNTNFGFFADVVLPVKLDTPSARVYMIDVLSKFKRELEQGLGVGISDEALRDSIRTYNRIRGILRDIGKLRSTNPGLLRGRDWAALVKGSMIMDRGYLEERLAQVAQAVGNGELSWDAVGAKRVILVGGICDQPEIYNVLEQAGGVAVDDDLCTGSRWLEPIEETGDPIEALAHRYINRPLCPAKHMSLQYRKDHLLEKVEANRAAGVIFLHLKFCDPHAFDYPHLKGALDRRGIPSLLYEMEDQVVSEGQLATRFEAFVGML